MDEILRNISINTIHHFDKIRCVDMHTGGEPLRIPVSGIPLIKGYTILEKRNYFKNNYDHIRKAVLFEPRGHADMYGAIVSSASVPEADLDVFFIHNEGYSTMCGHAVIALAKFVHEASIFDLEARPELILNVPAGIIKVNVKIEKGQVVETSFENVPSFLYQKGQSINIPEIGNIEFDIAFGGAFYAIVDVTQLPISLAKENFQSLIHLGRQIKSNIAKVYDINHPLEEDLSFLYGTIFTGEATSEDHHSRNVCIFADGEVDRSATGSGVSARAAQLVTRQRLSLNEEITIESILGSTMKVKALRRTTYHGYDAVIPKVTGSAHFVGKSEFWYDPTDPYKNGFIFR